MTPNCDCEQLDSFLDDELDTLAAARFQVHLRECSVCREAIQEQRWIDGLLRSPAGVRAESAPPTILESLRSTVTQRRQYVRLVACGLAAAAVPLIAAGWIATLNRRAGSDSHKAATHVAIAPTSDIRTAAAPQAIFSSGDAIVVPLESPAADVSIVQLYPTTDTELLWRSQRALQKIYSESNGG